METHVATFRFDGEPLFLLSLCIIIFLFDHDTERR